MGAGHLYLDEGSCVLKGTCHSKHFLTMTCKRDVDFNGNRQSYLWIMHSYILWTNSTNFVFTEPSFQRCTYRKAWFSCLEQDDTWSISFCWNQHLLSCSVSYIIIQLFWTLINHNGGLPVIIMCQSASLQFVINLVVSDLQK